MMKKLTSPAKLALRPEVIVHLRPLALRQIQGGMPNTFGCEPPPSAYASDCRPTR